jgi:excisionase family DNA binding protein
MAETTAAPQYMTTAEVAELLRTPPETLRFWRHRGKGPRSWKPGARVLYDRNDVEAWIAKERAKQSNGRGPEAA